MGVTSFATRQLGMRIISGNKKLGNGVFNYSTDRRTCGDLSQYCAKDCYMRSFTARYSNVEKCHKHNTDVVMNVQKENLWDTLQTDISELLEKKKVRYFRAHVNGDVVCKEEIGMLCALATMNPATLFLLYSKQIHLFDSTLIRQIEDTKNLQVKLSLFHTFPENVMNDVFAVGLPVSYAGTTNRFKFKVCHKACSECLYCFSSNGNVFLPLH